MGRRLPDASTWNREEEEEERKKQKEIKAGGGSVVVSATRLAAVARACGRDPRSSFFGVFVLIVGDRSSTRRKRAARNTCTVALIAR